MALPGMAIGAMSVNVPNYNAEVAPPEVRGSLVALQQLAITAGIMVSFWIDYGTNNIGGTGASQSDAAWLVPLCLQLVPGLALGIGMIFMPFSPRWLIHHGREAEARHVLSSLRNLSEDHELVELEFLEIKAQSVFEKRTTAEKWPGLVELTAWNTFKLQFVAIGSLFRSRGMFQRVIVATVTMFFQQFTGINAGTVSSPSDEHWGDIADRSVYSPLLRAFYIHGPGHILQHHESAGHRRSGRRHVHRDHTRRSLHRQTGQKASHDHGWDRHGPLPHDHCSDLRQESVPMANTQSSRMGRCCHGVSFCPPSLLYTGLC